MSGARETPVGKVDYQRDYSSQWIEYYRNLGLNREAEAIEIEVKQRKIISSGGKINNENRTDFSKEWVAYYRKMGLNDKADELEKEIASKVRTVIKFYSIYSSERSLFFPGKFKTINT